MGETGRSHWKLVVEPGQRWQAIGAPHEWVLLLEPVGDEDWLVRMAVGLERVMSLRDLLGSYELAEDEDEVEATVEAGGDLVDVDEVEGPNSA